VKAGLVEEFRTYKSAEKFCLNNPTLAPWRAAKMGGAK